MLLFELTLLFELVFYFTIFPIAIDPSYGPDNVKCGPPEYSYENIFNCPEKDVNECY